MASDLVFDPHIHRYTHKGIIVPSVTKILQLAGIGPDLSFIPPAILENKRELGKFVHEATEYVDMGGEITDFYPGSEGYIDAYRRFILEQSFEPLEAELQIFSNKLRYAGTIDRVGHLNNIESILDIKTTAALEMGYVGPQTAAYEEAYRELTGKKKALPRYVLQLKPDGTYKLEKCKDKEDFQAFLAALNIYRWRERHGKRTG